MRRPQARSASPPIVPHVRAVKTIAEQVLSPWNRPAGDELFGIQAIADYLELPFLDVRTLLKLGRLPTTKASIAHVARRTSLVAHFLEKEARSVAERFAAAPPGDVRPNGSLGLLKGVPAISEYVGCSKTALHNWRRAHGVPAFRIGKHWLARRVSLDLWRREVADDTPSERRRLSLIAKRAAAAPAGAIVGASAIASALGISEAAAFKSIYRGAIPAFRVGKGWAVDPARLIEAKTNMERKARNGERS